MASSLRLPIAAFVIFLATSCCLGLNPAHFAELSHNDVEQLAEMPTSSPDMFENATCLSGTVLAAAVNRFSHLLKFKTVSSPTAHNHVVEPQEWPKLDAFLKQAYPSVFQHLEVEKVGAGGLSYLLKWPGSANSSFLAPLLFISHLDVVPVPNETLASWTYPPFSGAIAQGYVWGRGALDVKIGVAGLLEAVTLLLSEGWTPPRTLYFAFGQDEEVGGALGADQTAKLLAQRNVTFDIIWDEGGSIAVDGFPPYTQPGTPVASVGMAEKGYATLLLHVTTNGGHSSIPPLDGTSLGAIVGRILTAVSARPPPTRLRQPVIDFLKALAPITPGWRGELFRYASLPYVSDLAALLLAHDRPETAAMVHTTVAVTGLTAGVAENVMPPGGVVRLNFRLLPGDTIESLTTYLQDVLRDDFKYITIETNPGQPGSIATPVTPTSSPYFNLLKQAIGEVWKVKGGPTSDIAGVRSSGVSGSGSGKRARDGEGAVVIAPMLMPGEGGRGRGKVKEASRKGSCSGSSGRARGGTGTVVVAPILNPGGTDSKHYIHLSRGGVLRHVPTSLNRTAGDTSRIHGLNERLSIPDVGRAICTYKRALQLFAEWPGSEAAIENAAAVGKILNS